MKVFYAGTLTVRINLGICQSCTGLTGISCNLTQYFTCSPSHTTLSVVRVLNNCSSCSHSHTLPTACSFFNWVTPAKIPEQLLWYFWCRTTDKPMQEYSLFIIYNKPTRCNFGSTVFIKNYKYALHVSDALCVHLQEH